jgi:hypothetical protein
MISHVLVSHLTAAEKKFDDARRRKG